MPKFNEKTTALEVIRNVNLKGYDAIVTGASSGIQFFFNSL